MNSVFDLSIDASDTLLDIMTFDQSTSGMRFEMTSFSEDQFSVRELPSHILPTKLPRFNTEIATESSLLNFQSESTFHQLSAIKQPIAEDSSMILHRFALLVAALTDSDDIAFVADIARHHSTDPGRFIARAIISKNDTNSLSGPRINMELVNHEYNDEALDFEIVVLPAAKKRSQGNNTKVSQPCILRVKSHFLHATLLDP